MATCTISNQTREKCNKSLSDREYEHEIYAINHVVRREHFAVERTLYREVAAIEDEEKEGN